MLGIMDWNLWGWGKAADMETEIKCSVNKCLLNIYAETIGCTRNSYLQALCSFPHYIELLFFADTSGDRSILETGPLSKFFR